MAIKKYYYFMFNLAFVLKKIYDIILMQMKICEKYNNKISL